MDHKIFTKQSVSYKPPNLLSLIKFNVSDSVHTFDDICKSNQSRYNFPAKKFCTESVFRDMSFHILYSSVVPIFFELVFIVK